MDIARETALKALIKIDVENGYSNIVLDEYLNKYRDKLTNKDINLISEIVYGVITWKLSIDCVIQKYSKTKIKKMSGWVLNILRIGAYQILFLDRIPKSAAVNESVKLAKKYAYKSSSLVNAILRKVEKEDYENFKNIKDNVERISKMYSIPKWLVKELFKEYSLQIIEEICKASNEKPKTTIRINTLKTNLQEIKKHFDENKINYEEIENEKFLNLKNIKNIGELEEFKAGLFTIQDIGAGRICEILSPKENEKVLDACSAPGGKTTYIAEMMNNKGTIIACDIHSHRLKLVEENAKRLGIDIIKTCLKDASKCNEEFDDKFDKILLDVPCLGIGVMKRKPDIKWQRNEEDLKIIPQIQYNILEQSSKYLKIGGEVVYSTCSILKSENEDIINKFLENQNVEKSRNDYKFILVSQEKILPKKNTDGFFIAKLKKISK